jgi:hypothetical protein
MAAQPKTRAAIKAISEQLPLDEMLARVAEGATQKQLADLVSERVGRPVSQYYVSKWLSADDARKALWLEAKQQAAARYADEVATAIDDVKAGRLDANSAKTIMSGAQWLASRLNPRDWGDRIAVDATTLDLTTLHLNSLRERMRTVAEQSKEQGEMSVDAAPQ